MAIFPSLLLFVFPFVTIVPFVQLSSDTASGKERRSEKETKEKKGRGAEGENEGGGRGMRSALG